jgi:L-fuculose-phosphate aldolase
MLAKSLGRVNYFSEGEERELLNLKDKWGFSDPRNTKEYENCDICANDIFRDSWSASGVERKAFEAPPVMRAEATPAAASGSAPSQEALVQAITERVMAELSKI